MTKHYAVVGLGGSGLSAVNFLVKKGHQVSVTDGQEKPTLADKLPAQVACHFGGIDGELLQAVDGIVISPGVDPRLPVIANAKAEGVPVVSDVQIFIDELKQQDAKQGTHTPVIAITGSNAKSTVTTLVGEMAKSAGLTVGVGGNIGTPALDLLLIDGLQMVVLELSSFQLEHISNLSADVATVLNISADHLDRHDGMADYLAQKLKIFEQVKTAIICQDDPSLEQACRDTLSKVATPATVLTTDSSLNDTTADFYLAWYQDELYLCQQDQRLLNTNLLKIKGKHNLLNALSALAMGFAIGLPMNAMLKALQDFKGLPHRCEYVAQVGEKVYFNDSKGTNIGSTIAAIAGLGAVYGEGSLAIILGGQGKGQDFGELADDVARYASNVYLVGVDASLIEQGLVASRAELADKISHCQVLDKAVEQASQSTAKVVLLSPACASLDQFKNYGERGERFVALVNDLTA